MKEKDQAIYFRLNNELKEKAEELADRKGLSLSSFIRYLLIQQIEEYESQGKNLVYEPRAEYKTRKNK
jgi:antitoxin component of RelBE/YafQ-DinJ toxin-antitoxin module